MTIFADIYRSNAWNGTDSRSGPGSGRAATARIAREISQLAIELNVASVLDVGCGDGFWMPDLPGYVGIDVAPEALELARQRHPDRTYRSSMRPRPFDLVIVRDAIQHLSLREGDSLLWRIRRSGSKWLLASTFVGGENIDIETGDAYSPDLQAEPFNFGPSERLIFDGWDYETGKRTRDPRKHLGLWRL